MKNDYAMLEFVKKEALTYDTFMFYFLRPQHNFDFLPGQYVSVYLDESDPVLFRDFSVASAPFDKKYITITTKKRESFYKNKLFTLQAGKSIRFSKPAGGFTLDEKNSQPKVFLAGGIGIVPLFNMMRYAVYQKFSFPLTIIASFTGRQDVLYTQELEELSEHHSHVQFMFIITGNDRDWKGEQGRISETLLSRYISNIASSQYYLAGSPEFVIAMEDLLDRLKIPLQQIKTEQFTGY